MKQIHLYKKNRDYNIVLYPKTGKTIFKMYVS